MTNTGLYFSGQTQEQKKFRSSIIIDLSIRRIVNMIPKNREPTHPGEVLMQEFLIPLSLSQEDFAVHLGKSWTQPKISAIVNKRRRITESIALDFADAFGTSPEFWIHLQTRYDLWHEQKKHKKVNRLPTLRRKKRAVEA